MSEQPDERDQVEPRVPNATREEITHMRVSEPCGDCMKVRPFKCPRHETRRHETRPEVSEQPLTADQIKWRLAAIIFDAVVASKEDEDHPDFAGFIAEFMLNDPRLATLDAARAGVPGDEGLYEAVLAYRSMHEPLCKCPAAQAIDAYLAPRASIAIEASDD